MELIKYNGLTPEESEELSQYLDHLLADYQVYRQNVRKMYWNVELKPYLDFHERLGQLYDSTRVVSNVVAETILGLGHNPSTTESEFLAKTSVSILELDPNFDQTALMIVRNSQELLHSVKQTFEKAAEYHEEFTMALMSRLARQLVFNIQYFMQARMAMLN